MPNERIKELISEKEIAGRVTQLAELVDADYCGEQLTLVCVLKGAVIFMCDLAKKLKRSTVSIDFMDVSSYGAATESSGIVRIDKDIEDTIEGKNVLLVEDIIDSGRTLAHVVRHLSLQNPKSLKVCTLLDKPERRAVSEISPEYVGFTVPDHFVVGYGLDFDQRYRNLPYIGVLEFCEKI